MKVIVTLSLLFLCTRGHAQKEDCGTFPSYFQVVRSYPVLEKMYGFQEKTVAFADNDRTITVKVYVHVLYKKNAERIAEAKIREQFAILNNDFAGTNPDNGSIPSRFSKEAAGNCKISFEIEKISYLQTSKSAFVINYDTVLCKEADPIKFSSVGGEDGAPSNQYLNVWIGNIKRKKDGIIKPLAGYATPPGGINMYDGVVLNYRYIGNVPNTSYNKGRTTTHEVGHWLDLLHISGNGENQCGNDFVDDTPTQQQQNYYCPSGIKKNCTQDPDGEMYMNYLDYVDDSCMMMFTKGQRKRMRDCFFDLTKRGSLLSFSSLFEFADSSSMVFDSSAALINSMKKKSDKIIFTWENVLEKQIVSGEGNYRICIRQLGTEECIEAGNAKNNRVAIANLKPGALYEIIIKSRINGRDIHQPYPYIFQADKKLPATQKKPLILQTQ